MKLFSACCFVVGRRCFSRQCSSLVIYEVLFFSSSGKPNKMTNARFAFDDNPKTDGRTGPEKYGKISVTMMIIMMR